MKKIISIALALLMVAVMLPVMAMAEGTNVAKIGDTEYATLEEAFTAVTTTDATTITLLDDADVKNKIIVSDGKNITLDLGGHNVTISELGKYFYVKDATFTVNGGGSIKEAAAYLAPIIMKGGPAGSENFTIVNVKNGVTLEGWAGMFIDQQNNGDNYGMVFNAENATLTGRNDTNNEAGVGLYVNGQINANVKISLTNATVSGTGDGMYLAGAADTTINGGSVTSSCTGIEIRAGSLTLNNCNVTGGNGSVTTNANGNGATSENVALAVIQHTTRLPIHVEINGGTFKGTAALLESNPQKNPEEATKNVGIVVNGGNFVGNINKNKDASNLQITGGTFSDTGSAKEYLAPGKEFDRNGNVVPESITIIVPSEGGSTTTTPSTDNTKNPSTGANDFVGVAAAMAVVSLLGAAAVIRKK